MNKSKLQLQLCAGIFTLSTLSNAAYGSDKIFDITHKISSQLPTFGSQKGLGQFIWLLSSIKNGSTVNVSEFKLGTHTGTHVDAPSHFFQKYYEQGFDVSTLSLQTLNGPALVVDVPRNKNITGMPVIYNNIISVKSSDNWFQRKTWSDALFSSLCIKMPMLVDYCKKRSLL
ncbi:hypothetical protein V6Z12_D12G024700 [Gossypium hirsutum]